MIVTMRFRKLRESIPHREGRYIVVDASGNVNVANWSPMWGVFAGWDIIANQPITDVVYWADVEEMEGTDV